jgi:hypothetical protein
VILHALYVLGWSPGAPGHVTAETLGVDAAVAHGSRCPQCDRPLEFTRLQKGRHYCGLATCGACGYVEEV